MVFVEQTTLLSSRAGGQPCAQRKGGGRCPVQAQLPDEVIFPRRNELGKWGAGEGEDVGVGGTKQHLNGNDRTSPGQGNAVAGQWVLFFLRLQ